MSAALIAAVAENGVIGLDGGMPWRLRSDLRRFKALTLGHTLVMGRTTYEGIGRPLPGRKTVVLTRDRGWRAEGVEVAYDLVTVLDRAALGGTQVFVAGGAQIYALAWPHVAEVHLSVVHATPQGDTWFTGYDPVEWGVVEQVACPAGERDEHAHTYFRLARRAARDLPAAPGLTGN